QHRSLARLGGRVTGYRRDADSYTAQCDRSAGVLHAGGQTRFEADSLIRELRDDGCRTASNSGYDSLQTEWHSHRPTLSRDGQFRPHLVRQARGNAEVLGGLGSTRRVILSYRRMSQWKVMMALET